MHKTEIIGQMTLIAYHQTAEVLQLGEEPFHLPAALVPPPRSTLLGARLLAMAAMGSQEEQQVASLLMRLGLEAQVNRVLEKERTHFLGRERYERVAAEEKRGHPTATSPATSTRRRGASRSPFSRFGTRMSSSTRSPWLPSGAAARSWNVWWSRCMPAGCPLVTSRTRGRLL